MKHDAAAVGKRETPIFMFQEGQDNKVAKAFMEIANLSGGIYARFDASSSLRLKDQLKDILRAVGQFAASGCTYRKPKTGVDRLRIDR